MACFDQLPDEMLLKIFSYLSIDDLRLSIRNVCTRWTTVSEDYEIWFNLRYCPNALGPRQEINFMLKDMPALTQFQYFRDYNFLQKLSEYCRNIRVLHIPFTPVYEGDLMLAMGCLPALCYLSIYVIGVEVGLQLTRIIGQSETLVSLDLNSSGLQTAARGLLIPIADGYPKLTVLKCKIWNSPAEEICYLLQRKKHQLMTYQQYAPVNANILTAISECTNLKSLSFFGTNDLLNRAPAITKLQNLKCLEISHYVLAKQSIMPLTLILKTLSHLSYIGLSYIEGDIDDLINSIILMCPALTHLSLEGNNLTDAGLRNIQSCKMLKYLELSACKRVGTEAMTYVAEGCPQLQHLDVSFNPVSDRMFGQILRCRNLKTLLMKRCNLTDINLRLISTHIRSLLSLFCRTWVQITRRSQKSTEARNATVGYSTVFTFI
jgi:Leucine-rich repeat (LRR) protein